MGNRTLPDEPLAYETHGEGIPVVFLHGLTFDRRSWGATITRLGAGVRSIAIDLPGHGDSPGPACGLEAARWANCPHPRHYRRNRRAHRGRPLHVRRVGNDLCRRTSGPRRR